MASYLSAIIVLISAVIFFTEKTEHTRVLTIQKPILVTQERRTPAYYAYQQTQAVKQNQEPEKTAKVARILSTENIAQLKPTLHLTGLRLTKKEYAQMFNRLLPQESLSFKAEKELADLNRDLESVVFNPNSSINETDFEQEPALSPEKKWATLRGKFELHEGVGIVNHITNIRRVEEGQTREVGRIDLKAGTYSIDIESPNGYLVAQIRDSAGGLVGEDRKQITNLQSKGSYYEGPFIRVGRPNTLAANIGSRDESWLSAGNKNKKTAAKSPTTTASTTTKLARSNTFSASAFDSQKLLSSAEQEVTNISLYSSSIMRIDDPTRNFIEITTVRLTGDQSETPTLTRAWLQGALQYISDTQKISFRSNEAPVLIGRVVVDGKPVFGAQVGIQDNPSLQAVYLDEFMIPSLSLKETSTNGYFMFVDAEAGAYEVFAQKYGQTLASQVFVAENNRVAFQNLQGATLAQNRTIRTFDAFTSEPVEADLMSASHTDLIEVHNGYTMTRHQSSKNVSRYKVRPRQREYIDFVYHMSGDRDYAHIPQIQEAWLEQIRLSKGLIAQPNTGVIIGFTLNLEYGAYLTAENYNTDQIVYFDAAGRPSMTPVLGGGFILFNVPPGAREVVLQENQSERLHAQVFDIVGGQVAVAHFIE